jgi:hypothetical protein
MYFTAKALLLLHGGQSPQTPYPSWLPLCEI